MAGWPEKRCVQGLSSLRKSHLPSKTADLIEKRVVSQETWVLNHQFFFKIWRLRCSIQIHPIFLVTSWFRIIYVFEPVQNSLIPTGMEFFNISTWPWNRFADISGSLAELFGVDLRNMPSWMIRTEGTRITCPKSSTPRHLGRGKPEKKTGEPGRTLEKIPHKTQMVGPYERKGWGCYFKVWGHNWQIRCFVQTL